MKLAILSLVAFVSLSATSGASRRYSKQTVVEIAAGNESFKTLVAAVKAAGLAEALSGDGPFTIFAPTDDAFKKLPAGTVEDLLKPENKEKLAGILKYHVVAAKVLAADGKVTVDGATVTKTDIIGKNGVIHIIDSVILPK